MSAHNTLMESLAADHTIEDPGNTGSIVADRDLGIVPIVTAAAETRTLADPIKEGLTLTIYMKTDGGDCTITATSAVDQSSTTSIVLGDVGDSVTMVSAKDSGGFCWRVIGSNGISGVGESQFVPLAGGTMTGALVVDTDSATALTVGTTGATNPAFTVATAASDATGIKVDAAGAASGVAVTVTSSGAAENLTLDAKGTGTITLNGTATGTVTVGADLTMADAKNVVLNTSTGTKIGTAVTQKLGFFNATPVVQPASAGQADQGAMTTIGSNTGTSGAGLSLIGDTTSVNQATNLMNDLAALQEDIAALDTIVTEIRTALVNLGLMKGAA